MTSVKLNFPEAEYNKALKAKFGLLDKITTEAVSISEMGSGIGIVRAYRYLVQSHEVLKNEILNFTPAGKNEAYVASFKASMGKVAEPLSKQADDFRQTAIKKIEKDNILTSDNSWFLVKNEYNFIPEYFSDNGAALMDKAGGK